MKKKNAELHAAISQNLTARRNANHLTQRQIASALHISRQAYSNYENNRREPDIVTLLDLSVYYHISLEMLIFNLPDNLLPEECLF